MTSNQIAYAGAVEEVRHDKSVEQETNRHNLATENLSDQQIQLDKQKLEYEDQWKRRDQELTEQYNQYYYELQSASLDAKIALETRLADITAEKNANDALHQQNMDAISAWQSQIDYDKLEEAKQHNRNTESLSIASMENDKYIAELRNRMSRYQTDLEYATNIKRLELQTLDVNKKYYTEQMKLSNEVVKLNTEAERVKNEAKYQQEDIKLRRDTLFFNNVWRPFDSMNQTLANIIRLIK